MPSKRSERQTGSSSEEWGMSEEEARQIAGKFKGAGTKPSQSLRSIIEDEKDVEKQRDERLSQLRE